MPKQSKENKELWDKYISLFDNRLKHFSPKIYKSDYTAVIVEPRKHPHLEVVLKNVMYFLNESNSDIKWGLKIYHGTENGNYVKNIVENWDNVELESIGVSDLNGILYNNLLKTTNFWKSIESNNVLIFQTDSLLLKFGIDEFISYIYIGAPWIRFREGEIVGNGGLSFRKRDKMVEISEIYKDESISMEDIYFCKYLDHFDIAPYGVAKQFSVEDVQYDDPLGLHQPKIETELLEKILKNGLDNIKL